MGEARHKETGTAGPRLHDALGKIKFTEAGSRKEVARGCRSGWRSECLVETDFQFGEVTEFWRQW